MFFVIISRTSKTSIITINIININITNKFLYTLIILRFYSSLLLSIIIIISIIWYMKITLIF